MSAKNQVFPTDEVVNSFVDGVVLPTLKQVAMDAKRQIKANLKVTNGVDQREILDVCVGSGEEQIDALLQLHFREAFGGRYVLFCEALFPREQAVNNCSGFTLKGDLRPGEKAKRTAWTMRYSVWDWTGWL